MKKVAILLLLLAVIPFDVKAFNTNGGSDALSYVAMPLAVSAVCDVRGVQTDRVAELVTYMNQANVAPADFIDVFRYVPVALVMHTDGRPDFVEWVRDEVGRGVTGADLASAMEAQLRTWDNYVPVSTYSNRRPRDYARESYDYVYQPDYVPVVIRRHCERLLDDRLSLVDMPVAVSNVCDLGVPYDRVGGLAIELNLGRVAPLQFVELMRYAPVALSSDAGYYGQPDFVQYVRTERSRGVFGDPLVQAVDRQLRVYSVAPQIDRAAPLYTNQPYYAPANVQNYVDPVSAAYVPPVVRTRVASNFAARRAISTQPAPAIAVAPQVQRLLQSPNGAAVVANPAQARRELARGNRIQRELPVAAAPAPVATPTPAPVPIQNRGRAVRIAQQPVVATPAPVVANAPRPNGRENRVQRGPAPVAASPVAAAPQSAPPGQIQNREKGRVRAVAIAPQPVAAAPAVASAPRGNGNGKGHERVAPAPTPAPIPAPMISSAPPPRQHGNAKGRAVTTPAVAAQAPAPAAPAPVARSNGRGGPPPAAAAATPAAPPAGPPGQEKKASDQEKKKDKGKD